MSLVDEVLGKVESLPPLPEVCLRLQALFDDPKCTPKLVAAQIERDALLATTVLKLANSAYFSVPGGVTSILRAVQMMGFSAIHQVVLCAVSSNLMGKAGEHLPPWMTEHSQAVSLIANYLANQARSPGKDMALAAGLLHDIGRTAALVLVPKLMANYAEAIRKGARHSLSLEHEILGADHQRIGRQVGLHWKYPPALLTVIETHHTPDAARPAPLGDIVYVADAWAWAMGIKGQEPGESFELDLARAERVGLAGAPSDQERVTLLEMINAAKPK